MPVTQDQTAPYAPASAILDIIDRHRNRGLPSPVDADVLARAGVSDSLIPRTLQSLRALDLIDDSGQPTDVLEGIRLAPENQLNERMADWLRAAYADALHFCDPATDDETKIRDAFRGYNPIGQQSRMVTLFTGLFAAAGIAPEKPAPSTKKPRPSPQKLQKRNVQAGPSGPQRPAKANTDLPPALAGLLESLPTPGGTWTQNRRDAFMKTFGTVLDFCYPISADEPSQSDQTNNEEETNE